MSCDIFPNSHNLIMRLFIDIFTILFIYLLAIKKDDMLNLTYFVEKEYLVLTESMAD